MIDMRMPLRLQIAGMNLLDLLGWAQSCSAAAERGPDSGALLHEWVLGLECWSDEKAEGKEILIRLY